MFSARALYNNVADAPEELNFAKGDILEVLEKDANGWWMCSFRGKVGIAPGNRLQPLPSTPLKCESSSGRNSPLPSQNLTHTEKLPPGSTIHSSRKSSDVRPSWHVNDKVIIPKKIGSMYVYDIPNHVHQDYDVPPSHHNRPIRDASSAPSEQIAKSNLTRISDTLQNYDVPSALRSSLQTSSDPCDNYDRLPALTKNLSHLPDHHPLTPKSSAITTCDVVPANVGSDYDLDPMLLSNRLSTLSVLSTGSRSSACSGHSSLSGSMSTQSSVDVSFQDIYDVPACSRLMYSSDSTYHLYPVNEQGVLVKRNDGIKTPFKQCMPSSMTGPFPKNEIIRQGSADPPSNLKLHVDRDSYLEDYSIPRSDMSQGSGDSGISVSQVDSFGSQSCSGEIYDTPRKLTDVGIQGNFIARNVEENTCDVPQHTSNQNLNRKNVSEERICVENFGDLSATSPQNAGPVNCLVTLQSNVLCHGSKLIDLIGKDLLGSHQQELPQIKLTCLALKAAVKEVLEFGNSLLSQISNPSCKGLSDKIFQLLEKVQVQYQYLTRHIEKLITTQWLPKHVERGGGELSELDDNLNTIQMLTETISARLLPLTGFIMQNSSLFVSEMSNVGVDCANSNIDKASDEEFRHKSSLLPVNDGMVKPSANVVEKQSVVQNRPLPPIPPLHPTSQDGRSTQQHLIKSTSQITNQPSSGVQPCSLNEWNDECDYVSIANEAENEIKAQEKLRGQQSSIKHVSGSNPEVNGTGIVAGRHSAITSMAENSSSNRSDKLDRLPNVKESPGLNNSSPCLSDDKRFESDPAISVDQDQSLMAYYLEQIETNFSIVDTAVREFFQMMHNDRVTAREFLLRSKFVILAAHKLVYIGDTITRNSLQSASPLSDVAQQANRLCDILKDTVAATKTSALNFPQNLAQQKLTECMKAVLHASRSLCEAIRINSA